MSADPKPPSINVVEMLTKIANIPITPKSLGVRRRANTILAINDTPITPNFSNEAQTNPVMVFFFMESSKAS